MKIQRRPTVLRALRNAQWPFLHLQQSQKGFQLLLESLMPSSSCLENKPEFLVERGDRSASLGQRGQARATELWASAGRWVSRAA